MSKNYEGTYRFTKVINVEGNEVFIPTEINPPMVIANDDGTYSPMPSLHVGPFMLQFLAVDDNPNTYYMRTRVVNSMGGRVVITESADGHDTITGEGGFTYTQVGSLVKEMCCLERATKDAMITATSILLQGNELTIQGPGSCAIHCSRDSE